MPPNLAILPATLEQIPLILSFIRKLAEYEKLSGEVVADEQTLAANLFGPNPTAKVIFAHLDDRPVGFAIFFTSFSTFIGRPGIYLEDLFVEPQQRGLGIGKALLAYLAKLAYSTGCGRLEWAVLDWNQPSIDFYEALGAKPQSEWTTYRLTGDALKKLAMSSSQAGLESLAAIPDLTVFEKAPLSEYTRFGIGGPAALFCDTQSEQAFVRALALAPALGKPAIVIGGGSNLIVSDAGFDGVVLRYSGSAIEQNGLQLRVEAGAELQAVVDRSIALGLKGLETMTGIPGFLGGAVYGNAGAYGHSIQEIVEQVSIFDGTQVRTLSGGECRFRYRDSIFKERKDWIILSATLCFEKAGPQQLAAVAHEIRTVRDAKYPPTMKCAGSIFKNLLLRELPTSAVAAVPSQVVREGKVPSAWFLEQAGVKRLRRGDIQVAEYHANLIYNDGAGTAADLVAVIREVKQRVFERFGFELEEEVQYVGFDLS